MVSIEQASARPAQKDEDALAFMRGNWADVAPWRALRRPYAIEAEIRTDDGRRTDCMIRDTSASGAKLRLTAAFARPRNFSVLVTGQNSSVQVYLVRRECSYAGLTIDKPSPA